MKVTTNLQAGMTFEECDVQRNYWKGMAQSGKCNAYNPYNPYNPYTPYNPYEPYYPYPPQSPQPPQQQVPSGGGWVGTVWYGDMSGVCG